MWGCTLVSVSPVTELQINSVNKTSCSNSYMICSAAVVEINEQLCVLIVRATSDVSMHAPLCLETLQKFVFPQNTL